MDRSAFVSACAAFMLAPGCAGTPERDGLALPPPAWTFINKNNLARLFLASGPFPPGIFSHHLFVAELAHEIVD